VAALWQTANDIGQKQCRLAKNSVEKSKVFNNIAAHLEEKYNPITYFYCVSTYF